MQHKHSTWALLCLVGMLLVGYTYQEMGFNSLKGIDQNNAQADLWDVVLGGYKHTLVSLIAGERNPSSATNSYSVIRPETNGAVISDGTTLKTVSSAPAHLAGVYIHTALTGTLTITCLLDEAGVAAPVIVPIGSIGSIDFKFARCETSLAVQKSSASDNDLIVVFWRPI